MSLAYLEKELDFETQNKNLSLDTLREKILDKFKSILKSYLFFHLIFFLLLFGELFHLFFYLTYLIQSFTLAINISLICVTIFSYLTLRLYFQSKKEEQIKSLVEEFLATYQSQIGYQEGVADHHLSVTQTCRHLANALHGLEYKIIKIPSFLPITSATLEKVSGWFYWNDIHNLKEQLLETSINEQVKLVRIQPTNLQVHAELANAYVMLSGLYVDPRTVEGLYHDLWIPPDKYNELFNKKFRLTAEKAIEEFKILNYYAPEDPWVHTQLAYSYHDLQMPKEEIEEYEIILRLRPNDPDILFKLGKLYFEEGLNAKGLQIYEKLKKIYPKKADILIHYYGATS
jgi:tetratricopeptide (TPR) repeat protein